MQSFKGTLNAIFAPNVPAATLQALSTSLCGDVVISEGAPPPADVAAYTTAMKDFGAGSLALHNAHTSAAQASAVSAIRGDVSDFNAFLSDIGQPAYSS